MAFSVESKLLCPVWIGLVVFGFCAGCSSVQPGQPPSPKGWRAVEVVGEDVRLDEVRPDLHEVGETRFRAGFALHSADPAFGGFSGLMVEGDHLLAVSDQGHWWRATLRFDPGGQLVGLSDSEMAPLADLDGRPVTGRFRHDAEELARAKRGLIVAFEGDHRTQLYRRAGDSRPRLGPSPADLSNATANGGMEAMTRLADGSLLVVSEDMLDANGNLRAWLSNPSAKRWRRLSVATEPGFRATAAATLASGDVLLLQRYFKPEDGARVRLLRLAAADLMAAAEKPSQDGNPIAVIGHELAKFQAPLSVDNFEALDVGTGPGGEVYAYILADDNYSQKQRTLLIQLELPSL